MSGFISKETLSPGIILYKTDPSLFNLILNDVKLIKENEWSLSKTLNNETKKSEISKSRKCKDIGIDDRTDNSAFMANLYLNIDQWINGCVDDFCKEYSIQKLTKGPYLVLKYAESDMFDWHHDDSSKFPRTVSVSAYLNEDYDGGTIEFKHYGIDYKPKAGDIIVFGSSFSYAHKVHPVTSGIRYAVVNWYRHFEYPASLDL